MSNISVIVPVYKVEPWLRRCVDSVLAQTYSEFELILVDDGSPDRCGDICDEYAQKDPRVHVIHQKNGGLSAARNAGIERALANGSQWLAFVDSDDEIAPNYLSKMYGAVTERQADLCICDCQNIWSDGREDADELCIPDLVTTGRTLLEGPGVGYNWHFVIACNKLYRKELFNGLRFPLKCIHEDEAVYHHILGSARTVVCISDRLYHYYRRAGSIMGAGAGIKTVDYLTAKSDRVRYASKQGLPVLYQCSLKDFCIHFLEICYVPLMKEGKGTVYPRRAARAIRAILPDLRRSGLCSRKKMVHLLFFSFFPNLVLFLDRRRSKET